MATLQEMTERMQAVRDEELSEIRAAGSSAELEEVRRRVLGKKGRLSLLMRDMGKLGKDERPEAGKVANEIKDAFQQAIDAQAAALEEKEIEAAIESERIDISLPGTMPRRGNLHPTNQVMREIEDIFVSMGFSIETGPDIEDDYHTFEALNFPADHPARDSHDTFYLAEDLLLRTHTSPVQIHAMKASEPPLAFIAPGKCYRVDADVTHSPMFHQIEGFAVDTNIRFSDLKGVLQTFIHRTFGPDVPYRFRPHYFPFTEPSAEVDILFERRHPNGHMVREWLEILGAGMIHPNVLQNCGINSEEYTGFAFGMGVERIAMLKYGIHEIGTLFGNDVRFLSQFQ